MWRLRQSYTWRSASFLSVPEWLKHLSVIPINPLVSPRSEPFPASVVSSGVPSLLWSILHHVDSTKDTGSGALVRACYYNLLRCALRATKCANWVCTTDSSSHEAQGCWNSWCLKSNNPRVRIQLLVGRSRWPMEE